jgi:hypothetical protein
MNLFPQLINENLDTILQGVPCDCVDCIKVVLCFPYDQGTYITVYIG